MRTLVKLAESPFGDVRQFVAQALLADDAPEHKRYRIDPATDQMLVVVSRLPQLPADRAYQLWFVRPDSVRDSGGIFRVGTGGEGTILARAPAGLDAYTAIGITEEPVGGSPQPTGPRIVGTSLAGSS